MPTSRFERHAPSRRSFGRRFRAVRTVRDGDTLVKPEDVEPESSSWFFDGYGNDGRKLPIGIYIVYFEATGLESVKGSVVIAR